MDGSVSVGDCHIYTGIIINTDLIPSLGSLHFYLSVAMVSCTGSWGPSNW